MTNQQNEQSVEVAEQPTPPVETTEIALANWNAQSSALVGFVAQAAQDLNVAEEILGQMYAEAEQVGDETKMQGIGTVWQMMQQKVNQMVQLDAAREAAVAVLTRIDKDKKEAEKNYDELYSAVENMDSDDPRVADLIQAVEEGVYEYAEYYYDDEEATWEQVVESLRDATKIETGNVGRFVSFLQGWREITDEQRALLITLIQAFNLEIDEAGIGDEDGDE